MYSFGRTSKERLSTCHPDLQKVFNEVIKHVDCKIIEGARTPERQQELFDQGRTKILNSKHIPKDDGWSYAVDVMAFPVQWENWNRNYLFVGFVLGIAASMGIKLRVGADWDGDFNTKDQSFHDLPHFELVV